MLLRLLENGFDGGELSSSLLASFGMTLGIAWLPWSAVAGPIPVGPDHWHPQPQCLVRG